MMKGALPSILDAVGHTPIVKLQKVARHVKSEIYVKCEYLNPAGSMKDRVAINIVDDAERRGLLRPGGTIIEATSGNTGMGLAMVAAVRGYQCIFVMPDKMSQEKIASLRGFGAKVVICPTAVEPEDPRSYYSTSRRIVEETPDAFYANQYHNPANPEAHYASTAPEVWEQTGGDFDVFAAGMGTGGTLSGCARYFKERKPGIKILGVDPIGSLYYEYVKTGRLTKPFSYYVEGIGEDFLPSTMNLAALDEIVRVDDKECFLMTRRLTREEGLFVGGSCGAAVAGAIKYAEATGMNEKILILLPDGASKYMSKIFNDEWMRQNGFLDAPDPLGVVADLLARHPGRKLITARRGDTIRKVIGMLKEHGISQVPVLDGDRMVGLLAEVDLLNTLVKAESKLDDTIDSLVESDYATVTPSTRVVLLRNIFNDAKLVVVQEGDAVSGIITKIDLIEYLAERRVA
ncbi:MAG: pyridoxal-phosphate dependent enzyme [Myxococcales bacterium]|nr:pyridoxal-phosphate dependent enzyme [Myxococcales bacterium]